MLSAGLHPDLARVALLGWRLAPVARKTRAGLWRGYMDDATSSLDTLAQWSHDNPGANWAVIPDGSGVWALDVDIAGPDHAHDGVAALRGLCARHGPLPPHPHGRSGGGGHLLIFRTTSDVMPGSSRLAPGLDTCSRRSSFTVAPSLHRRTGLPYRWVVPPWEISPPAAPEWMLAALAPPPPLPPPAWNAMTRSTPDRAERALARAYDAVASAPRGARNSALLRRATLLGGYVAAGAIGSAEAERGLIAAGVAAGQSHSEATSTVRSGLRRGKTRPIEWVESVSEITPHGAVRGFRAAVEAAPGPPFAAVRGGNSGEVFSTYGIAEIIAMPPPAWLVKDIITTDGIGAIYGPPASLKSFLALGLSLCCAYGRPWMGRQTLQTGVLYVAAEGVRGMGRRIRAWQRKHSLDGTEAPFRLLAATVNLTDTAATARLINTAIASAASEGCVVGLVVIDTVARAMAGADENSAKDMGVFIAGCDAIRVAVGCAVLGIHHSGKDIEKGARGSSAFLGAMDMLARVERAENGNTVTLKIEKQKEEEEGPPLLLAVEKIDLSVGLLVEKSLVLSLAEKQPKGLADKVSMLAKIVRVVGAPGRSKLGVVCDGLGKPRNGASYGEITDAIPFAPGGADVSIDGTKYRLYCGRDGQGATSPIIVICQELP